MQVCNCINFMLRKLCMHCTLRPTHYSLIGRSDQATELLLSVSFASTYACVVRPSISKPQPRQRTRTQMRVIIAPCVHTAFPVNE